MSRISWTRGRSCTSLVKHYTECGQNIPVESVDPKDPSLVPIDLDTAQDQTRLARLKRPLLLGARRDPHDESNKGQSECSDHLEDLVLNVLLLCKGAGASECLLLAEKEGSRHGHENERVKETEGECLVLLRDDGSQNGGDGCEGDDAGLRDLQDLEAARRIFGKGEELHAWELHDCVVMFPSSQKRQE
jgi:hypothetical protein